MTAPRRQGMRRAIVILPGAFTSGNLFFGIWSIIEAARGNFMHASWFIVVAGVMDLLDGRIARMSRTGTAFGAELDSLVDVISFGVAPALLLYFHSFKGGEWSWLLCFLYILAAALRLARFNVEQSGHAKTQFFGLPSPAAGMTLATYYPFAQTPFFNRYLEAGWPWNTAIALLVVMVSLLMVSHVPYPVVPKLTFRTWRGLLGIGWMLLVIVAALYFPAYFFFPFGIAFIGSGLVRAAAVGFLDRMPERDPLLDNEEEGARPTEDDVSPKPPLPFRLGKPGRRQGGQ
ncbi:MAG: CDP-diacylglycerol--serine O-phosphatidyltransferase [Gemmatimonadetes bacterium]|nr:CDP-diacylglycerol--serine O-phosphatidyltransferase [Gemmatimonadota bacterium]